MINNRIVVTGGDGFLGRHVVGELWRAGYKDVFSTRRENYDLREVSDIKRMLDLKPDVVIHLAANVGGIGFNQEHPAELFYDNAIMGIQLINQAYQYGIKKFVQIGTICEYPNVVPIPFSEDDLWNGYPEPTNAPYGLAKKMLLVQGQAYRKQYGFNVIHLMPVNLYGPGDNFNLESSHVMPALIRKFVDAQTSNKKQVTIWGSGQANREFIYVSDAAEAIVKATTSYDGDKPVNIGSGIETSIVDLAKMISEKVGFEGEIVFDSTKPDGQMRRVLDTQRAKIEFDFTAKTSLSDGLDETIEWYLRRSK